jgi:predicted ArsR family transcriptional regulator
MQAERDLKAMWNICRDFFYKWRESVSESFGEEKASELVKKFWEKVGEGTAVLYKEHGINPDNLEDIARAIARSSEIMGEKVEIEKGDGWVVVRHLKCPWWDWARRFGLEEEDKEGCDVWFRATVSNLNPKAKVETVKSFVSGDGMCERRIYFE